MLRARQQSLLLRARERLRLRPRERPLWQPLRARQERLRLRACKVRLRLRRREWLLRLRLAACRNALPVQVHLLRDGAVRRVPAFFQQSDLTTKHQYKLGLTHDRFLVPNIFVNLRGDTLLQRPLCKCVWVWGPCLHSPSRAMAVCFPTKTRHLNHGCAFQRMSSLTTKGYDRKTPNHTSFADELHAAGNAVLGVLGQARVSHGNAAVHLPQHTMGVCYNRGAAWAPNPRGHAGKPRGHARCTTSASAASMPVRVSQRRHNS